MLIKEEEEETLWKNYKSQFIDENTQENHLSRETYYNKFKLLFDYEIDEEDLDWLGEIFPDLQKMERLSTVAYFVYSNPLA